MDYTPLIFGVNPSFELALSIDFIFFFLIKIKSFNFKIYLKQYYFAKLGHKRNMI